MTISSTLLALVLMPLCLWIYSRAWINTPVVDLLPFGAIILTLCSTLIPIGLGVMLRHRHTRVADIVLKVRVETFTNTVLREVSLVTWTRTCIPFSYKDYFCAKAHCVFFIIRVECWLQGE